MIISGEVYVTMAGVHKMLRWYADSLVFKLLVSEFNIIIERMYPHNIVHYVL